MAEPFLDRQLVTHITELSEDVVKEGRRQVAKFGVQEHSLAEWSLILNEEVGELNKELCDMNFADFTLARERERAYVEAIQVATLALKVAEMMRWHP